MDPWKILGISKGSGRKTIRSAYRKRSKETHPDLNPEKDGSEFDIVTWAYKAITAPEKAGECPIDKDPDPGEPKREKAQHKPNMNPEYAKDDPTLRWFDPVLREHLINEIYARPQETSKRSAYRPEKPLTSRRKVTLDDLMEKEKNSYLGKKWAEKLERKR